MRSPVTEAERAGAQAADFPIDAFHPAQGAPWRLSARARLCKSSGRCWHGEGGLPPWLAVAGCRWLLPSRTVHAGIPRHRVRPFASRVLQLSLSRHAKVPDLAASAFDPPIIGALSTRDVNERQEAGRSYEIASRNPRPTRSLFGDGIPRSLLLRVWPAKPTSAPLRF